MRRTTLAVAILLFLSAGLLARERAAPQAAQLAAVEDSISVWFSPQGGCEAAIVAQLAAARKTIDLQAYSFTSKGIAQAIVDIAGRGVRIRAVLDKEAAGEKYSGATFLTNHQIPVWLDGQHPIAHNKIMIIDGEIVITGSFNFTRQAEESNAENLLVIQGKPKLAAAYVDNFNRHLAHSKAYARLGD